MQHSGNEFHGYSAVDLVVEQAAAAVVVEQVAAVVGFLGGSVDILVEVSGILFLGTCGG